MPEAKANMAYTRFVLEAGMAGDLLDLCVALAPCVVGYAEIGQELAAKQHGDHPYRDWIKTYSDPDYQDVVRSAVARLDELMAATWRSGPYGGTDQNVPSCHAAGSGLLADGGPDPDALTGDAFIGRG